ncbi:MAG: hypothetical protein V8R91_16605, partial [Butyricimonas faecihominis]
SEDIVQDAFVYLWNNRKTLEIKTTIQTYLYSHRVARSITLPKKQMLERTHLPRLAEFIIYLQESEYSEEELIKLKRLKKSYKNFPTMSNCLCHELYGWQKV